MVSGLCSEEGIARPGEGAGDHARAAGAFLTGMHPKKTEGHDIRVGISMDQLAARERGQYTAMLDFAAGDAVVHGRNGPVPARPVFSGLQDPVTTIEWSPRTVIMSCDGNLAVSSGRYREPEGLVGTFMTVWERDDRNDDYEWSYDVAGRDDPQPPPEVIEMATNSPVTMVPISIAPRVENAADWPAMRLMTAYMTTGANTGSMLGNIISLIAVLVKRSTQVA